MPLLLVFFVLCLFGSPLTVLSSQTVIADLEIAGTSLGTKTFTTDGIKMICSETITFGKCKSNTLNDIGSVTIDEAKDTKFVVRPKTECLPVGVKDFRQIKPFVAVASVSGFVNFAVSVPDIANMNTQKPSFNGGVGLYAWDTLFYSDLAYNPDTKSGNGVGFRRGATYLKRDLTNYLAQVQAGDLYTVTNSQFLKGYTVGGVQLSRKYTLDPTVNPYNSMDYKLTLTNKSRVEIYRNEQLVAVQELPAGIYDMRNLPIAGFTGDLKIKIIDVYGHEQIINVPFFVDASILKPGMDDFNLGFGFARKNQNENSYSKLKGGGFYRRGITEALTIGAGFSFDDGFATSINAAYKTKYGVLSAEKDLVYLSDNYSLGYYYSADKWGFGANYTKSGGSDLRLQGNLRLTMLGLPAQAGSITGQVFLNGDKKYGITHSFNPISKVPLSVISDLSYSTEKKFAFQITSNFAITPKLLLGLGYGYDDATKHRIYASLSIPLGRDYLDWGLNMKAYHSKDNSYIDNELSGRYYMLAKERSAYNSNEQKWTHSGMVSGSVAFSNADGKTLWGIGEAVSPTQGYFLSPPGKMLSSNGQNGSIITVVPYLQTPASVQGKTVSVNKELSLREGQGFPISTTAKRSLIGKLLNNGKPLKYTSYFFNNEEFRTGKDGGFVVEGVSGNSVIITVAEKPVSLKIPDSVSDDDELVNVGTINVSLNEKS